MSITDDINIKITGQLDGEQNRTKREVLAELEMVCARYDLSLEVKDGMH